FNIREFYADAAALRQNVMDDAGFVLRVDEVSVDPDGIVRVRLQEARVDSIEIEGNAKTKEFVIRREMTLKPGDVLDVNRLRRDLRRILQLGYFDSVTPVFADTTDPDRIKLIIQVAERKTGAATFGAGYSSADGFLGYVDVSDENFLGRGQRAHIRWEFGQRSTTYDLGFYEPYLSRSGTSLGFNLFRRSADREQPLDDGGERYNELRLGGDATIGQRVGDFSRISATYRLENVTITPLTEGGSIVASDNELRTLKLALRTNTTDDPFYPTSGFTNGLSVEKAGDWLGGDVAFTKYEGDLSTYWRIGSSRQTIAMRVAAGTSDRALPFEEEFRLGGSETVRGYQYGAMHGDTMLLANLEYRFPIVEALQGVVFVDAGNAWSHSEPIELKELKHSYGVGVRLQTPLGVIRVDYGIGEDGGRAHFSLGPTF
ncbi:MAG TPA: BamA/TamA family outer membrane protein, partial [Limnochordia bacterium]